MNATWISVCRPKGVPVSLQLLPAGRHDLTPPPLNALAGRLKAPYCARLYEHELAIQVFCQPTKKPLTKSAVVHPSRTSAAGIAASSAGRRSISSAIIRNAGSASST
jgi:hypothetical protein